MSWCTFRLLVGNTNISFFFLWVLISWSVHFFLILTLHLVVVQTFFLSQMIQWENVNIYSWLSGNVIHFAMIKFLEKGTIGNHIQKDSICTILFLCVDSFSRETTRFCVSGPRCWCSFFILTYQNEQYHKKDKITQKKNIIISVIVLSD